MNGSVAHVVLRVPDRSAPAIMMPFAIALGGILPKLDPPPFLGLGLLGALLLFGDLLDGALRP